MREKLIKLIYEALQPCEMYRAMLIADHLIANGVTVQKWIPVTERLPENEVDVLILAERRLYGIRELDGKKVPIVAKAFHTDGKMNTEESCYNWELDNVDMVYDEEADAYIVPE